MTLQRLWADKAASRFFALAKTLSGRLETVGGPLSPLLNPEEDVPDDELADEAMDADEAADLELRALAAEEMLDINGLLAAVKRLPPDSKAGALLEALRGLQTQGYRQVMVFTQYTDTMDFLRTRIAAAFGSGVLCFSGRGGEMLSTAGNWETISRDATKQRFREGRAEIMVCTELWSPGSPLFPVLDAIAREVELEGLNWKG